MISLANTGITIGNKWRTTLLNLDDDRLRKSLGDILDESQLAALAKRRDDLIKASTP